MRARLVTIVIAAMLTLWVAAPVGAIGGGEPDDGAHPQVGMLLGLFEAFPGFVVGVPFCTGTHVAAAAGVEADVFLTAAHCLFPPPSDPDTPPFVGYGVTFEEAPMFQDVPGAPPLLFPGQYIPALEAHRHPGFEFSIRTARDYGVVLLPAGSAGVGTLPVAPLGFLDSIPRQDLQHRRVGLVGYGVTPLPFQPGPPAFEDGLARQKAQAPIKGLLENWLKLNINQHAWDGGVCFGDSGGPQLLEGYIVSVTSRGDRLCRADNANARTDIAAAHDWLSQWVNLGG